MNLNTIRQGGGVGKPDCRHRCSQNCHQLDRTRGTGPRRTRFFQPSARLQSGHIYPEWQSNRHDEHLAAIQAREFENPCLFITNASTVPAG